MCSDQRFADNRMPLTRPSENFSRVMDACTYLEHEQSNGCQEAGTDTTSTVLTYLAFLEHKIGHLRGILCSTSTPHSQQQIVSAELSCIIVQLISITKSLVSAGAGTGIGMAASPSPSPSPPRCGGEEAAPDDDARSPLSNVAAQELMGSDDSDDQDGHHADADEEKEHHPLPPAGSYEVVQIEKEEILAPHVHACKVCGKGFKRDANLRMHMRGHGHEYKTAAALARPSGTTTIRDAPAPETARRCFYSCPYVGCKRNREHRDFQPLKTAVCVKNHYRRSHCDKRYTCRRCNVKKFSVLADLRTHEKHCGRDRWVCSCGTSFSRKDKLFGHVAVFDGHTPALPPEDAAAAATATGFSGGNGTGSGMPGSGQQLPSSENSVSTTVNMDHCFSDSMFDDFRCSDIKGRMDDGREYLSPMGLDSCDFDGFDLFGTHAIDFDF